MYSYDTLTGEVSQQTVLATYVLESDHLNYLTIVDEDGYVQVIETTDSHPFWVVTDDPDLGRAARDVVDENGVLLYHNNIAPGLNGFWVEAKDLREGDVFLGANGELSELVAKERVEFPDGVKVYNFLVDGNNDYFVIAQVGEYGQTCILAHNAVKCHDHHIVMKALHLGWKPSSRAALKASQNLLKRYDIGINDVRNIAKNVPNEGHTIEYTKKVWKELITAAREAKKYGRDVREAILTALDDIAKKILDADGLGGL